MKFCEIIRNIDGIILDADGTLLDSMGAWEHIASSYVKSLGTEPCERLDEIISSMTLEEGGEYIKNHHPSISLEPREIVKGVIKTIDEFYRERVMLKSGALTFLKKAAELEIPMIIATTGDKNQVIQGLERNGASSYVSDIISCSEFGKGKDDPEIFYHCKEKLIKKIMKKTDKNQQECRVKKLSHNRRFLVCEDSFTPLKTAGDEGFMTMGIKDEYAIKGTAAKDVFRLIADYYIEDWEEIQY